MTTKTSSEQAGTTTQASQLKQPFPPEALRELNKGGARLTYVPVSEVIARLNNVLGVENWEIIHSDAWRDSIDPNWVIAKVEISATIDGTCCTRVGWGGQEIKHKKNTDLPQDLGDEFKGASSDALKKAAQTLGVALDLARDEDMLFLEREASLERASSAQLDFMKEYTSTLSDEQKEEMKEWFRHNLPGKTLARKNLNVEDFFEFLRAFNLADTWESL